MAMKRYLTALLIVPLLLPTMGAAAEDPNPTIYPIGRHKYIMPGGIHHYQNSRDQYAYCVPFNGTCNCTFPAPPPNTWINYRICSPCAPPKRIEWRRGNQVCVDGPYVPPTAPPSTPPPEPPPLPTLPPDTRPQVERPDFPDVEPFYNSPTGPTPIPDPRKKVEVATKNFTPGNVPIREKEEGKDPPGYQPKTHTLVVDSTYGARTAMPRPNYDFDERNTMNASSAAADTDVVRRNYNVSSSVPATQSMERINTDTPTYTENLRVFNVNGDKLMAGSETDQPFKNNLYQATDAIKPQTAFTTNKGVKGANAKAGFTASDGRNSTFDSRGFGRGVIGNATLEDKNLAKQSSGVHDFTEIK